MMQIFGWSATVGRFSVPDVAELSPPLIVAPALAHFGFSLFRQSSRFKSGTTTADGTTQGMATSYLPYGDLYETDPDTAMAWTSSGVDNMQVGIEVVS